MSEPLDPAQDPEYAAALDRFLDGLLDDPVTPADAQVRADTDAIVKALGLIGGALAAEGSGTTAAAGAVPPVAAGGATVVQMSSWRSKLNPRVLAAAASLVVLLGVGIPVAMSTGGGSDSDESAAGAPNAAVTQDESAATAPGAAPAPMAGDAYVGTDTAGAGAAAAPGATDAGTGTTAGGAQRDAEALAADAPTDPTAAKSGASAESQSASANAAFANAVACARAIFVGIITAVQPEADGQHFKVAFLVEDWIVPDSGPVTVSYRIYGSTANSPGQDENVLGGQRRLFIVPGSEEERISAYREKDWAETKKQIKAVRDERAGEGC